jgi:hypothetical protein
MIRTTRIIIASISAIVAMAFATSATHAATVGITTRSTVATISGLTVNDNALGSWVMNVTLTATLRTGLTGCGTNIAIGGVTASRMVVNQPAGITESGDHAPPWPITTSCSLSAGGLLINIAPRFALIGLPLSPITYSGGTPLAELLNAAGFTISGVANSGATNGAIPSDRGTTFTTRLPSVFSMGPAVAWTLLV